MRFVTYWDQGSFLRGNSVSLPLKIVFVAQSCSTAFCTSQKTHIADVAVPVLIRANLL